MGCEEHERIAPHIPVGCAVVTVSDSRTETDDESGRIAKQLLLEAGHRVLEYRIVKNDRDQIESVLKELICRKDIRLILTSGGTGIGRRDLTVTAARPFLERTIEGFGELFRFISFGEIGPASMMSGAIAGICSGKLIFCLPGSANAVRLALSRLIIPQVSHMIWELDRR